MTGRELLELAAKAAGIDLQTRPMFGGNAEPGFYTYGDDRPEWVWWNPLTDDGDALRLAVKLGLLFSPQLSHFLSLERFLGQDRDDCTATRRAIVRAAAEIGKGMA